MGANGGTGQGTPSATGQGTGPAATGNQQQQPGTPGSPGAQGQGDAAQGAGASGMSGSQGTASPQVVNVNPAVRYAFDPNNPDLTLRGAQALDAIRRGQRFDGVQSALHRTQNELQTAQQQLQTVRGELNQLKEDQRLRERLTEWGVFQNQSQNPPTPSGVPAGDDLSWLYGDQGTGPVGQGAVYPGVGGVASGTDFQGENPPTGQQGGDVLARAAALFNRMLDQRLGNMDKVIADRVQAGLKEGMEAVNTDRARRERVQRTFDASLNQDAERLRNTFGLTDSEVGEIHDLEGAAQVLEVQATEMLMSDNEVHIEEGRRKLTTATQYRHQASDLRADARIRHAQERAQEEAQEALESGSYLDEIYPQEERDKPVEPILDPAKAKARHDEMLQRAKEIAARKRKAEASVGGNTSAFPRATVPRLM